MSAELESLSRQWNKAGRAHAKKTRESMTAYHTGKSEEVTLPDDPRDEALACRVLDAVVELNVKGKWQEARRWFDPAHEPLISKLDDGGLPFVVALGGDEALFRRGSTYQDGHLWHVAGEHLTPLPEWIAAAISQNREILALVDADGIQVVRGWRGDEVVRFGWPTESEMTPDWVPKRFRDSYTVDRPPVGLETLAVSNDGTRVAIASSSGVMVGTVTGGRASWQLVLPRHDEPGEWELEELEKGEEAGFHGDMVHVAMTPDGRFVACGSQDDGHFIFEVDADGKTKLWAQLGHASEYPHNACFSADGDWVALNSCHFYNGATIAAHLPSVQGVTTEPYEEDTRTPTINGYLRVYASTWLPPEAVPGSVPAFALAGSSMLTIVGTDGTVQGEFLFGSSACSLDYCPSSRTMVLGSYSGFLHFLRPHEVDPEGLGWQAPVETKRWCFFKNLPPIQW